MQLSRQRASWEFVQTVTWGKLYLLATPTLPPPTTSPLRRHISFSPSFSPADRFRQTDVWRYQRFQSAFSASRRSKGRGKRRASIQSFDCLRLCSHTAGLHAQLLSVAVFYLIFESYLLKDAKHLMSVWMDTDTDKIRQGKNTTSVLYLQVLVMACVFKFWLNWNVCLDTNLILYHLSRRFANECTFILFTLMRKHWLPITCEWKTGTVGASLWM